MIIFGGSMAVFLFRKPAPIVERWLIINRPEFPKTSFEMDQMPLQTD
jgi:hypothetical protein